MQQQFKPGDRVRIIGNAEWESDIGRHATVRDDEGVGPYPLTVLVDGRTGTENFRYADVERVGAPPTPAQHMRDADLNYWRAKIAVLRAASAGLPPTAKADVMAGTLAEIAAALEELLPAAEMRAALAREEAS